MYADLHFIDPKDIVLIDFNRTNKFGNIFGGIEYEDETLDNFLNTCSETEFKSWDEIKTVELLQLMDKNNVTFKDIEKATYRDNL